MSKKHRKTCLPICKILPTFDRKNILCILSPRLLMAAQGAFGTDFYDRSILRPKHRAYYRSGRPVLKIGPKGQSIGISIEYTFLIGRLYRYFLAFLGIINSFVSFIAEPVNKRRPNFTIITRQKSNSLKFK